MSKPDIERLRALAAGAWNGPWLVDDDTRPGMSWNRHIYRKGDYAVCFMAHNSGRNEDRDEATANLIAACDPQTILGLIDAASEAEALRAEVAKLKADADRLDFLDSNAATQHPAGPLRTWLWARPFGSNGLRKMIDAAIAASKPAGEAKP